MKKRGVNHLSEIIDDAVARDIAYFSMEIGVDPRIPTYSGGLGVLAGDTVKSFADLKVPVVAVTLLFRKGHFYQKIDDSGMQHESPVEWSVDDFMQLINKKVTVKIEGREVQIQAWVHYIQGVTGFKVPILFLDTNIPDNNDSDKGITDYLYGGDERYRLMQEIVLGIGGVRMLKALGLDSIKKYHMNEGHSALLTLELLGTETSVDTVREKCVFTTHTPVPAGHDKFEEGLVRSLLGEIWPAHLKDEICEQGKLNMTLLALRFSKYINGVAKKHGEVSRTMFPKYHIDSITNGVHSNTWSSKHFRDLYDLEVPGWRTDPFALRKVAGMDKFMIWDTHLKNKKKLIDVVNKETNSGMDYDIFTIGFARRFTEYKRPDLLFYDIGRLLNINDNIGAIQIIFSGKAHPKDGQGKETIKKIISIKNQLKGRMKIAYLENYDMDIARLLVSGVDIWLNTPLRPREASGTSGMKAAHNGVPHLSVLDGWWIEGHIEDITGWSIGPRPKPDENETFADSSKDVEDLYHKLESRILPLYYKDRDNWTRKMRSAIAINASFFNTHRMVQQYVTNAYFE
ncbi:MAG: alpha-glucan family phosphorylase [Nanoarchaeota archaeon]|nr:alpha-glucan family phosphorylase [Nanoarchaeota archaeon]